jgi:nicotinamidase-related amidase
MFDDGLTFASLEPDPYTAPDFAAAALITIDTQRDVLDGQPLEIAGTSTVLPAMAGLLSAFRQAQAPIVHIVRLYRTDGSNVDLCRRSLVEDGAAILAPETEGSELAPGLLADLSVRLDSERLLAGEIQQVASGEVVIYKPRWGAFFETPLEAHLRDNGVSTVVLCGCNFPNCPRTSIYEASERDFRVVLATDAISGLYERGQEELSAIGVQLMRSETITAALDDQRSRSTASRAEQTARRG